MFESEKQIELFILNNPNIIEADLKIIGNQVPCGNGKIDLLAGSSNGEILGIELKNHGLKKEDMGQLLYYVAFIQERYPNKIVRKMLVGTKIDNNLSKALNANGIEYRIIHDEMIGGQNISLSSAVTDKSGSVLHIDKNKFARHKEQDNPELVKRYNLLCSNINNDLMTRETTKNIEGWYYPKPGWCPKHKYGAFIFNDDKKNLFLVTKSFLNKWIFSVYENKEPYIEHRYALAGEYNKPDKLHISNLRSIIEDNRVSAFNQSIQHWALTNKCQNNTFIYVRFHGHGAREEHINIPIYKMDDERLAKCFSDLFFILDNKDVVSHWFGIKVALKDSNYGDKTTSKLVCDFIESTKQAFDRYFL